MKRRSKKSAGVAWRKNYRANMSKDRRDSMKYLLIEHGPRHAAALLAIAARWELAASERMRLCRTQRRPTKRSLMKCESQQWAVDECVKQLRAAAGAAMATGALNGEGKEPRKAPLTELLDALDDKLREACRDVECLPKRKRTVRWKIAHFERVDMLIEFRRMVYRRLTKGARGGEQ